MLLFHRHNSPTQKRFDGRATLFVTQSVLLTPINAPDTHRSKLISPMVMRLIHCNPSMAAENKDEIIFPFLSLSPEIRNIVYVFALTSSPLRTRCTNTQKRWIRLGLVADCPKERILPSLSLLLASRQIYHEASYVLYHHGCFQIPVFIFNTLTTKLSKPGGVINPPRPVKSFSDLAIKAPLKCLSQIQRIDIEINWFRSRSGTLKHRSFTGNLDANCRGLTAFPHLRAVTVVWQSYSADPGRLMGERLFNSLGKRRTLELLESLRKFQEGRPEVAVVIELPSSGLSKGMDRNTEKDGRAWALDKLMERFCV